jgi:two-component system cell cycle response regulator
MSKRIVLIDSDELGRDRLAARLGSLEFEVDVARDATSGAEMALASPPAAVIADLWMSGISGVQLCRLLRAEPATAHVPVVLRSGIDDPRSRFWAEQAGAAALVPKGRMGDLARALRNVTEKTSSDDGFFMHLGGGSLDIHNRIAQHLDAALFESVIAAEVRALGSQCSFDRLFDALTQLASRLMAYRWLALSTVSPGRLAIHSHPLAAGTIAAEVSSALGVAASTPTLHIEDEDALQSVAGQRLHIGDITFGPLLLGRIAIAGPDAPYDHGLPDLVALLGRELGAPIRMATLVEEAQRLATTDSLTGLLNRRAFGAALTAELARAERSGAMFSVLLFDLDHFKSINDRFGHAAGDAVLTTVGKLLPQTVRAYDKVARWGGEEFAVLLPATNAEDAATVGERVRDEMSRAIVECDDQRLSFTTSVGVATATRGESFESVLERADRGLYSAKAAGRNLVCVDTPSAPRFAVAS